MFTSGTELRSFLQRGERKIIAVLTITGTALPFIAGLLFVLAVDMDQHAGPARNRSAFMLVFACAIAVTSIPVISRIMMDLKILHTAFARVVLTTAVFEDIVLYVVLAVALGLVRGQAQGATSWAPFLVPVSSLLSTQASTYSSHFCLLQQYSSSALLCYAGFYD